RLEVRGRRRRGRRERRRRLAALERGQTRLERIAVRIGVARVKEAARIRAVGLALERGGRVDGGRDRARSRIDAGARVDGDRLDSHGTHAPQSAEVSLAAMTTASPGAQARVTASFRA